MDALTEAKEQYQKNARSHAEIIDQLLRTYNERVQREESNYRRMLSDTLDQTDDETDKLNRWQNEDEISLQSITRGVQRHQEESLNNVKSITLSKAINLSLAELFIIKHFSWSQFYISYFIRL